MHEKQPVTSSSSVSVGPNTQSGTTRSSGHSSMRPMTTTATTRTTATTTSTTSARRNRNSSASPTNSMATTTTVSLNRRREQQQQLQREREQQQLEHQKRLEQQERQKKRYEEELLRHLLAMGIRRTGLQDKTHYVRPPYEFRKSKNLNDSTGLDRGKRLYLNDLCYTYSVQPMKSLKQAQFLNLLQKRRAVG